MNRHFSKSFPMQTQGLFIGKGPGLYHKACISPNLAQYTTIDGHSGSNGAPKHDGLPLSRSRRPARLVPRHGCRPGMHGYGDVRTQIRDSHARPTPHSHSQHSIAFGELPAVHRIQRAPASRSGTFRVPLCKAAGNVDSDKVVGYTCVTVDMTTGTTTGIFGNTLDPSCLGGASSCGARTAATAITTEADCTSPKMWAPTTCGTLQTTGNSVNPATCAAYTGLTFPLYAANYGGYSCEVIEKVITR